MIKYEKVTLQVPEEILLELKIQHGIDFHKEISLELEIEDNEFDIKFINNRIVVNNGVLTLEAGNVFEGSLSRWKNLD